MYVTRGFKQASDVTDGDAWTTEEGEVCRRGSRQAVSAVHHGHTLGPNHYECRCRPVCGRSAAERGATGVVEHVLHEETYEEHEEMRAGERAEADRQQLEHQHSGLSCPEQWDVPRRVAVAVERAPG